MVFVDPPGRDFEVFVVMHHMESLRFSNTIPPPHDGYNPARPVHLFDTLPRAEEFALQYAQSRKDTLRVDEVDVSNRELHDCNDGTLGWGWELYVRSADANRPVIARDLVWVERQWVEINLNSTRGSSYMDADPPRALGSSPPRPYYV